ncbi:MAG: winged helix-turn-helix transcriptional regulator [Rikenellaceae bacterium]|nr:winged helix-turn-helix transcriptional regulator [Rikenellaceae bacterium]
MELDSRATQKEIAEFIGKSIATAKRLTVSLQEKGFLIRHNGKRYGWWVVLLPMLNT